jgi:hypothetical protein
MSDLFDTIFENALISLKEKNYVESSFEDNVSALLSVLSDQELLDKNKSVEYFLQKAKATKEIVIGLEDDAIPTIKLKLHQNDSNFGVDVINLNKPNEPITIDNDMLETIFDRVVDEVRRQTLENVAPESAITKLPQENGAQAQPGAEQTALPTNIKV